MISFFLGTVLGIIGVVLGILPLLPRPEQKPSAAVTPAPSAPHVVKMPGSALTVTRIGPAVLYPDPNVVPGEADTLDVKALTRRYTEHCAKRKIDCTYAQSHRDVSSGERKAVYDLYHVPKEEQNLTYGEIDHFYPVCAGGSNEISNLWYQRKKNVWNGKNLGFDEKDKLEKWVCKQIKDGNLDPREAYIGLIRIRCPQTSHSRH